MPALKLKTVTRTQGNNRALKDGTVKPKTFEFQFEEVDPLIAGFLRRVRADIFNVCQMSSTIHIGANAHDIQMTTVLIFLGRAKHHGTILVNIKAGVQTPKNLEGQRVAVKRGFTSTTGVVTRH